MFLSFLIIFILVVILMSLIKCPECNKEVSDQAQMCPNCGFGIEKYVNKIKEEKQVKIRKEKLKIERQKRKQIEEDKLKQLAKFENMPKHKPIVTGKIIIGIFFYILFITVFIYFIYEESTFFAWSELIFGISCGSAFLYEGIKDLNVIRLLYTRYKNNEEKYKIEVLRYYKNKEDNQVTIKDLKRIKEISNKSKHVLHCPYCNSTNVKKITTTSRVVSTAAVGVASNKIGKQWHCNKCKSNF